VPTVLIGSIFYRGHKIFVDEDRDEFDRDEAEKRIRLQDLNTTRILQRATGSISPVETCSAHNPCSLILSKTCVYRLIDASHTMLRIAREMSDYRYGPLDGHPSRRSRRRDEHA
jgi:hypothetical protein